MGDTCEPDGRACTHYEHVSFATISFCPYYENDIISYQVKYISHKSIAGNIFRVTGPLWGESKGHRWVLLTKASDAELWWSLNKGWTNCWVAGDMKRHDVHVTSLPVLRKQAEGKKLTLELRNKLQLNLKRNSSVFIEQKCMWKCLQIAAISSQPQCVDKGIRRWPCSVPHNGSSLGKHVKQSIRSLATFRHMYGVYNFGFHPGALIRSTHSCILGSIRPENFNCTYQYGE